MSPSIIRYFGCILCCMPSLYVASAASDKDLIDNPEVSALVENAKQGDPDAEYELGTLFQKGEGITQNDAQAIKWLTLAANAGNTEAQVDLGIVYRGGFNGEVQDSVEAYKWFDLAFKNGDDDAFLLRNDLAQRMTLDEIDAAKKLVREWKKMP